MKKLLWALILLPGLLWLSSCTGGKKLSIGKSRESIRIEHIWENSMSFQTLDAKVSISINQQKVTAQLRIAKDSCFWISIQPFLGIEAFRIFLTPEHNLVAVDRLHKFYAVLDLRELPAEETKWILPFLSRCFTNCPFFPENDLNSLKRASKNSFTETEDKGVVLDIPSGQYNFSYKFDNELNLTRTEVSTYMLASPVSFEYSRFQSTTFGAFPTHLEGSCLINGSRYTLGCDFQRTQFDSSPRFDTSLPLNYQEINFVELIKSIL